MHFEAPRPDDLAGALSAIRSIERLRQPVEEPSPGKAASERPLRTLARGGTRPTDEEYEVSNAVRRSATAAISLQKSTKVLPQWG